jgi:hypothetical protein
MKMDTSFWTQLNPTVNIQNTKKAFYDVYINSIKIYAPGCKLLRDKNVTNFSDSIIELLEKVNTFYSRNHFFKRQRSNLENADSTQLHDLSNFIKKYNKITDLKFRFEEPHAIFYSNDINLLKTVANLYGERVLEISIPASDSQQKLIADGNIIRSQKNSFKYKITLNRCFNIKNANAIADILSKSEIENSASIYLISQFRRSRGYYSGGYFYTNDDRIVMLLNIVHPGIVGKIYNMVDPE